MNLFEIYISYISWGSGGKLRPVLVFSLENGVASVYSVTSQYANKSEAIRKKFFKIDDWAAAGLDAQSYVDTISYFDIPVSFLQNKTPIGQLTESDKIRLKDFLSKKE